jgi:putative membrane protein
MIPFVMHWTLSALCLLVVARIAPGFDGTTLHSALLAAIAIGLLNAVFGELFRLLQPPFSILSRGIFFAVLNGLMILLAARLTVGFEVHGFLPAFWGAIVLGMLGMVVQATTVRA